VRLFEQSLFKRKYVNFLIRSKWLIVSMPAYVVTTDPSCLRMIPSFVGTGTVRVWSIAGSTIMEDLIYYGLLFEVKTDCIE
jgi:hypothetical protein